MIPQIEKQRQAISEICSRYGVIRLEAFGSALREDFDKEQSDIDLLVELGPMEPYERVDAYFGLRESLKTLLDREIDLVMAGAVKNPYIADDIHRTKQLVYAA